MALTSGSLLKPAEDFWRTVAGTTLPDGTIDTTESIRRIGHTGIGGADITEAMPVVTTPSAINDYLHLSSSALNRGQILSGNSPLSYYFTRTLPIVVNDYVEMFSVNVNAGAHNIYLTTTVSDTNFSVTKSYVINVPYNMTAGTWKVLPPLADTGPYLTENFEVIYRVTNAIAEFRARRTSGAVVGTLKVRIQYVGDVAAVLTELTAVGTDAGVYPLLTTVLQPDFWRSGTGATLPDGTTDVTDSIVHNGNVGIGLTNPATTAARLDVNGAEVLRGLALTNFTANAAIGTAAATVDINSTIIIPQTTAGITLTLPAPANTQSGRILGVLNTGKTPVTVGGITIANGTGVQFVWSGTVWVPEGSSGASPDFWRSGTGATLPDGTTDVTDSIVHNGNIGIGLTDPSTNSARLDVSGSTVLRAVALTNFTTDVAIGTAAATVDIASTITINQTTFNRKLTIPNPTNTQAGRVLNIANIGTVQVKVGVVYITPGRAAAFIWTGTTWNLVGDAVDFATIAASRAAAITDHLKTLLGPVAAVTLTINANIFQYGLFRVRQTTAAGIITIAAGAGMVLVAPYGAATVGLAGADSIVEIVGTNIYVT